MKYLRDKPAGIDIPIQAHQNFFYDQMKKQFGITDDVSFDLYGRARNNTKSGGSVAEVEKAKGEYLDVMFNDALKVGQGFYVVGDRTDYRTGSGLAKVALILQYTLTGIPGGQYDKWHDEQVNAIVMNMSRARRFGFTLTALVRRIDSIFREFPAWKDTVKFTDLYPWHVIRLEFDVLYNIDNNFECKI